MLPVIKWSVANLSEDNLENLLITVHVEGDVFAFDSIDNFTLRPEGHERPRLRGPRKLADRFAHFNPGFITQSSPVTYRPPAPRPTIQNGGSATIEFRRCTCARTPPKSQGGISC